MPLTRVQGPTTAITTANAANLTVNFPGTPTQGNLLICCASSDATLTMTSTGWNLGISAVNACGLYQWWKIAGASEPVAVKVTPAVSDSVAMMVEEYSGNVASPLDKTASAAVQAATSDPVTGTTAATTQADEQAIGAIGQNPAGQQLGSTWGNSYVQAVMLLSTGSGSTNAALGVAEKALVATGTTSTDDSGSVSNSQYSGLIATYMAGGVVTPDALPIAEPHGFGPF